MLIAKADGEREALHQRRAALSYSFALSDRFFWRDSYYRIQLPNSPSHPSPNPLKTSTKHLTLKKM
jgi:hypothetical protein